MCVRVYMYVLYVYKKKKYPKYVRKKNRHIIPCVSYIYICKHTPTHMRGKQKYLFFM